MSTAEPITPPPATPRKNPSPRLWSPDEFRRMRELGVFDGHAVELLGGTVFDRDAERPFALTRKEYYALDAAGFFIDRRVQLIGGEIFEESPMLPAHATGVRKATRVLERVFATGHDIRPQLPLNLSPHGEPHPDVAVVAGSVEDYAGKHPTTAVLVVEVSESTFEHDTHEKMSLYAAAGIAEYWVIDTTGRLIVFRDPRPETGQPFGAAYGSVAAHTRDDIITPLAAPDDRIGVAELLP